MCGLQVTEVCGEDSILCLLRDERTLPGCWFRSQGKEASVSSSFSLFSYPEVLWHCRCLFHHARQIKRRFGSSASWVDKPYALLFLLEGHTCSLGKFCERGREQGCGKTWPPKAKLLHTQSCLLSQCTAWGGRGRCNTVQGFLILYPRWGHFKLDSNLISLMGGLMENHPTLF